MRARRALALPVIAILAVAGGLIVAGCGGSSDSSGSDTTLQSQNAAETGKSDEAMKKEDEAMKHDEAMKKEDGAMKHEGEAMHDEGSMKHDSSEDSMKHEDDSMKHDEAMQKE
jgi:ABC-type glycerol-3-phosphate transport system substrate-binding protein